MAFPAIVALSLLPGALLLQGYPPLRGLDLPSVGRQLATVLATMERQLDRLPTPPFARPPHQDEEPLGGGRPIAVVVESQTSARSGDALLLLPEVTEDFSTGPAAHGDPDAPASPRYKSSLAARGESDGPGENGGLTPFSRQCGVDDTQLAGQRKRLSVPIFGKGGFCHGLLAVSGSQSPLRVEPIAVRIEPSTDEMVGYLTTHAQLRENDPSGWTHAGSPDSGPRRDVKGPTSSEAGSVLRRGPVESSPPPLRRKRSTTQGRSFSAGFLANGDFLDRGFDQANELLARISGLMIEEITVTQGYSSNAIPRLRGVPLEAAQLGHDLDWGASAALRWRHFSPRSAIVLSYEPSLIRRSQFPEWNTTNHNLRVGIEGQVSPRWEVRLSGRGVSQGVEQFFFDPPVFRRVENPPSTLDDLADAIAAGKFTDDEIAAILTGSPVVDRPGQADLDVRRVVTTGARASASYARSRRLSLEIGGHFLRSRAASGGREDDAASRRGFVSGATSARAEAGFTYQLSPESKLGVEVSEQKTESSLRSASYTAATASYDKEFGRGWSVRIQAGAGAVQGTTFESVPLAGEVLPDGLGATWIVGGKLGYNGRAHRLSVSTAKNVGDNLGLGSQSSISAEAQYQWAPRGASWSFFGGGNAYRADALGGRTTIESKLVRAGIIRRVGDHGAVATEYNYGSVVTPFTGLLPSLSRHRVQVSFIWKPSGER